MHAGKKSQKREKSVMSVSLYGNVVFVVIELVMAIATGSQAVLLDAVYDGVEFFMLLPSVFLIPLLYRPSTEQHPFGYMQLETLFVVVKGITMTAVTFGLIFNNIHLMLHGGHIVSFHTIAGFEMFACILSVIVTIYLRIKNKNLHSPLITMELQVSFPISHRLLQNFHQSETVDGYPKDCLKLPLPIILEDFDMLFPSSTVLQKTG